MRNRRLILVLFVWLCWPCAGSWAAPPAPDAAQIVLVGAARTNPELSLVLSELLQRDGVASELSWAEQFSPDALLAAPDGNGRVRVFITLPTPELARLYLRGPFGRRFLLRELSLRSGLDELGRESIAQVVAASTQALLHSSAGLDREAARAGLLHEQLPVAPPLVVQPDVPVVTKMKPAVRVRYELAARVGCGWTGNTLRAQVPLGAELGLSQRLGQRVLLRQRLLFEQSLAQTLSVPSFRARVRTSSLRLGVDAGLVRGPRAFLLGVAAGADLIHVEPEAAHEAGWMLAKQHTDTLPMLRAELRFERQLSRLLLSVASYLDVALAKNHYDVREDDSVRRVAKPWPVTPGLALSMGFRSR